ncbi:hypothetical protein ACRE_020440 [Hapsidospora chrysogenum ATCC 11550]|uniref:Uncharacterized protein n=1 Tax=Hapsidospora chrysogenum (strain ATCC 11550 / CBS 779.69 / DSM 880 / IAM 14645 / JCM 23072 / IMI 49137) TaxID=857340 RepID=A0A086TCV9_HAPC1|nr:hypothetical protein ACRE_020440 [Hapsidospora chrysogenum ATCC 11550]
MMIRGLSCSKPATGSEGASPEGEQTQILDLYSRRQPASGASHKTWSAWKISRDGEDSWEFQVVDE